MPKPQELTLAGELITLRSLRATHHGRSCYQESDGQGDDVRRQQDRLLNLMLSGTLDEQAYRAKNTELRDRLGH